ncbi:1-phosphofructokinase family hexose kinase [Tessaracoccus oleiagri]|uniref:1-phosphofructokinase n=1 Tax=Tessaracoccus oleiagri TaxID=686624 RepID=A0A1G9ICS6_9ACTN|nr:PfkB family carbohydrate kinase [Tessaracoccus oleiagri]SDL23031.1 1-phosphofructokinase [Tessaracoccus oleiagri]
MLVVCMNPTMDRQVFLPELRPGSVSRATRNRRLAGGKPVDVLRAMAAHEFRPTLLVVLPEHNEGYLELLREEGLDAETHEVPGHLRETIICYEDSGRSTVINGQGQPMTDATWQPLRDALVRRAADEDWVVLSGSFPPGVSADQVARLVADLRAAGAKVALDTGPAWLAAALPAGPDLITPNLAEAQQALSAQHSVEAVEFGHGALDEALTTARELAARGVRYVVVTVGSAGAAWATPDASGTCASLEVETVNPIGAGDAFLGGLLATLAGGDDFAEAVAMGTATAASAVLQWIPGRADAAQVREFRERLR